MKQFVKSALLVGLVSVNIAALGLTAGSTIYLLKKGMPVNATEESKSDNEISEPDGDSEEDDYYYGDDYEMHASAEDNVVIGGEYVIRSTVQISDAYQNGDPSALSDADKETYDMAAELLGEIITDHMTDYEKEKAVYDWMTKNLSFDDGMLTVISTAGSEVDCPHGVLKSHKAVCVGFATTFRLLMQMMNIDCKVVHDSYLSHSWDCVKIGDHWYFVDIYSDVGSGNYAHFNLTSAMLSADHDWDMEYFPIADSLEYNPAYQSRVKIEDVYGIPAAMREAMNDRLGMLCIEFAQDELNEEEVAVVENFYNAIDGAISYFYDNPESLSIPNAHCLFEDPDTGKTMLLVTFYDTSENEDPYIELSEEAEEKANEALQDAFGDLAWDISVGYNGYDGYDDGWWNDEDDYAYMATEVYP